MNNCGGEADYQVALLVLILHCSRGTCRPGVWGAVVLQRGTMESPPVQPPQIK